MFAYLLKRKQESNVLNHHKRNIDCMSVIKHVIVLTNKLDCFGIAPRRNPSPFSSSNKDRCMARWAFKLYVCNQVYMQTRLLSLGWLSQRRKFVRIPMLEKIARGAGTIARSQHFHVRIRQDRNSDARFKDHLSDYSSRQRRGGRFILFWHRA